MIRLSKLTDYAIVVMAQMARDRSALQTVPQLADRTGVPAPTVAKLLKLLTPAGLMTSHRGAAGGYTLARPAEDITMAEIIAALEGPIALTACVDGSEGHCGVESCARCAATGTSSTGPSGARSKKCRLPTWRRSRPSRRSRQHRPGTRPTIITDNRRNDGSEE
jgi:FeS assembly SUF system regulator